MKDFLVLGFIITASIKGNTSDEQAAFRNASRAFYKQSHLEADVNRIVKKEVPRDLQIVAGNTFIIIKTLQEKRLTITWSF